SLLFQPSTAPHLYTLSLHDALPISNIYSKRDDHEKAVELLKIALQYTDDYADVYNLIGMEYLFMDNLELAKENFIKCLEEDIERSEEHTSELQSRENLVCRLLLEKK